MLTKEAQQRDIIRTFVNRLTWQSVDAIQVTRRINEDWGVSLDWHFVQRVLEEIEHFGGADRDGYGPDRMVKYIIRDKPR